MFPAVKTIKLDWNEGRDNRRATLSFDRRAFSFHDAKRRGWKAGPGRFAVLAGSSSA
ncbi:MAG: fibronectin type III-like domain-contianing protein [Terriglobales bacterium]